MEWCEHCQDHYDEDHYDDDGLGHKVGAAYGITGEELLALEVLPDMLAILRRITAYEYFAEGELEPLVAEARRAIKKAEG